MGAKRQVIKVIRAPSAKCGKTKPPKEPEATPEILLYRRMLYDMVLDSLREPIGALPDYETDDTKSNEWVRVRDKRRRMNRKEHDRLEARRELSSAWADGLHNLCYGGSIDTLLRDLKRAWAEIDADPSKAKLFIKKFK